MSVEGLNPTHEEDLAKNETRNEGFIAVPFEIRKAVLEKLGEKEASTRVFAVFEYTRFHHNVPLIEAKKFVEDNMVGETPYGYPIWNSADNAGRFVGGLAATEGQTTRLDSKYGAFAPNGATDVKWDIPTVQYSVLLNEDGSRGGIGGGIKQWHEKDAGGKLTAEVAGYVNF